MKTFKRFISNRKAVALSVVNAIAIFLLCYFVDNLPYSFVGDATVAQQIEQVKLLFFQPEDTIPSDLLLINTAYDRQLVDVNDEFGMYKGNIDITDRAKLLELLEQLKKSRYKYIILDIIFSEEYETPEDSALFSLIASMPNIVIPKSNDIKLATPQLAAKAKYSDYSVHIKEYNFVKYEFVRDHESTLPYKVYSDLYGDNLRSFGPFYFFNGKLANKSVVLRHPVKLWNKYAGSEDNDLESEDNDLESENFNLEFEDNNIEPEDNDFETDDINIESDDNDLESDGNYQMGDFMYFNLGSEIIDVNEDVSDLADGKIVVIGDFTEDDLHDTYLGKISGPIINLNAFYALQNDDLSIPYWYIAFILLLYFTISYFIIKRISLFKNVIVIQNVKSKVIRYVASTLGISALLYLVAVIIYVCFNLECNILVPSIYFAVLLALVKYKDNNF